jgi:hypothetical protein
MLVGTPATPTAIVAPLLAETLTPSSRESSAMLYRLASSPYRHGSSPSEDPTRSFSIGVLIWLDQNCMLHAAVAVRQGAEGRALALGTHFRNDPLFVVNLGESRLPTNHVFWLGCAPKRTSSYEAIDEHMIGAPLAHMRDRKGLGFQKHLIFFAGIYTSERSEWTVNARPRS